MRLPRRLFWIFIVVLALQLVLGRRHLRTSTLYDRSLQLNISQSTREPLETPITGPTCVISQISNDQLGYQIDAKFSCLMLSIIDPKRFRYVHTPLQGVADIADIAAADAFINAGSGSPMSKYTNRESSNILKGSDLIKFLQHSQWTNSHCQLDREYYLDNCWDLLFEEPYLSHLPAMKTILREKYLQSPKVDTGFESDKKNIVLFVQSSDAKIPNIEKFFEAVIYYFLNRFENVQVWVESDYSSMPIFKYLRTIFSYCAKFPTNQLDLLTSFHRMAMADGLGFVTSNFGIAAAMLSNADTVLVPIGDHGVYDSLIKNQRDWFQQIDAVRYQTIGNLGFTNRMLVNMVHHVDKAAACPITQFGKDGFGHQLEGKLSCALLSLVWPSRFPYKHTPFLVFEHLAGISAAEVENFTNIGEGFERTDPSALGLRAEGVWNPAFRAIQLDDFVNVVRRIDPKCDPHRTYIVDNCWGLTYIDPALSRMETVRYKLRENYLKTPKPSTGFDTSRKNIVVHMRNGDSNKQQRFYGINETNFFIDGMKFYVDRYSSEPIDFWIETDSIGWEPISAVQRAFSNVPRTTVHMPDPSTHLLTVFHRMVMADGMVMSPSSFSNSAAMLSAADKLVITAGMHGVHVEWMKQERFVHLK